MGYPQGGVLSPLLWLLTFDDLLDAINNKDVLIVGYADDGCLIIEGTNLELRYKKMQQALDLTCKWAANKGINLSPEKTVAMVSTRKMGKNWNEPKNKLKIYGKEIELSEQATYLGIIIDRNLTWKTHVNNKITQAMKLLFKLRSCIGKLWGPSPDAIIWGYKAMVRSVLT
jgi:hypothetical protein